MALSVHVRQGETSLELYGQRIAVTISGASVATVVMSTGEVTAFWAGLSELSIPLVPAQSYAGVGGSGWGLKISSGMSRIDVSWWMEAPTGWDIVADVFRMLAKYLPPEVRDRYDFGAGGE